MKQKLTNIASNTGKFIDGNPATGTLGTVVTAKWLNDVQDRLQDMFAELNNVLGLARLQPNDAKQNQVAEAIQAYLTSRLTNDIGLDSEVLGLSAKGAKNLAQQIAQNKLTVERNYIPNSKKSSSISDNSEDKVATSKAAKTAFDKGVEALNKANELDRTALKNSGTQTLNGILRSHNANGWSGAQYGANSGFWQLEFHPNPNNTENRRGNLFFQETNGNRSYLGIPHFETGDNIAYQRWVNKHLEGYIANSKKSAAVNSTSNDTVATSAAAKTAYDKGVAAENNANGRVSKSGDTMTGDLLIRTHNSDYSRLRLFNRAGKEVRVESLPDEHERFFMVGYRNADGRAEHSAVFPKMGLNKVVAYEDWADGRYVAKAGDEINWLTIKRELATLYVKSTNNPLAGIDLTVQNGKHPQVSFIAQDRGRWAVDAEIWTTPDGENYEHNRRQLHTKFHSDGNIWNKNYGWLHEKFIQRGDFVRTWYPNHYRGAEVYKIRHLGLMIIVMDVGTGNQGVYNLPEAFDGFAIPMITDNGGARNVGARMEGNNRVYLYGGNTISRGVIVIGSKNV